jgi:hypothetical protein
VARRVLRIEDFQGNQFRIDEALKDRERGTARIGETKTVASDSSVPVPPNLARGLAAPIAGHPECANPPRRSREMTHFCSLRLTHTKNRFAHGQTSPATSSTPQACGVLSHHLLTVGAYASHQSPRQNPVLERTGEVGHFWRAK